MNTKKMIYEYFPIPFIELQKEIGSGYHPKLVKIIEQHTADDIDIKLAQIAAYCEVILDGDYVLEDRIKLCNILREKLILRRENPNQGIVLVN